MNDLVPDRSIEDLIDDRDQAQDMADRLAAAIARLTGIDIGEHSSENDPWANALDAASGRVAMLSDEEFSLLNPAEHAAARAEMLARVASRRRSLFSQPHGWTPHCSEACNHGPVTP